jgi:hypothetical protein
MADGKIFYDIPCFITMTNEINKLPKGWQRVTLGEITSLVQNGVYKPADKYGYGYPLLRMYNIQNTSYNLNCNHLARVMLDKSEFDAYKVKAGDILVSRVNSFELVGKSAERQAEHLFQTLLHRAFRGELTSSDYNEVDISALSAETHPQQPKPKSTDKAENLPIPATQPQTNALQLTLPGLE